MDVRKTVDKIISEAFVRMGEGQDPRQVAEESFLAISTALAQDAQRGGVA
jgi:hypothetical protein